MPQYKLVYFNGRGRAEGARMLFALGNIEYEDKRVTGEEWAAYKPKTPNGTLPVLEVDGKIYAQSAAIASYVAEIGGLNGKCALDRLKINQIIGDITDVFSKWPLFEKDEALKKKKETELLSEQVPRLLANIEKNINDSGFYIDQVSGADVAIYNMYEFFNAKHPACLDKSPKIKKLAKQFSSIESVAKWLKARPETPF